MAVAPENNPTATTPAAPSPASSGAPAPAATPTPSAPPTAAPAASPAAPLDVHAGLMEAATAALKKTQAAPSTASQVPAAAASAQANGAAATSTQVPPGPEAAKESKEGAAATEDDESKPPPFNDHPRWKKLQRDHAAAVKTVEVLQPRAEQYDKITQYMDHFQLSADDVSIAYDLLAKLKTNPVLAYQTMQPIWEELCRRVGVTLPDDLRARVEAGSIDEASARELARARAVASTATTTANETVARTEQQRTRDAQVQSNTAIQSAVAGWDTQQTSRNPDYKRLRPFVENEARAIMAREGKAKTPEAAVAVLDKALKATVERLAPFRPHTNGSTPLTPNANTPSTAVAAVEPKSLREAAEQGLAKSYRFKQ